MDELFEVILEFFAECYIGAMTLLVPEKKIRKINKTTLNEKEKQCVTCRIVKIALQRKADTYGRNVNNERF